MIETPVRLLSRTDGIGLVEIIERHGCDACGQRGHCGLAILGGRFRPGRYAIPLDGGEVRPGQEIRVAVVAADLWQAALWVYLLPVILSVAAAATLSGAGDPVAALGAILGLAVGLLIARRHAPIPRLFITPGARP